MREAALQLPSRRDPGLFSVGILRRPPAARRANLAMTTPDLPGSDDAG
jgi:hypothetical protein